MADRSVTVRLKVADDFSSSVDRYSQKMHQAEQSTTRMNTAARQSQSAFSGMGSAITGAVAAFGVIGVARLAEDIFASGMNAQRATALFNSFSTQLGNTAAVMDDLRSATRGVVDDVSLMEGASRLLSMGIAQNADDVTHLTSIAATFAQAMGTDVAGALEQVSLIISNESYLRLDSLGIGSGQVRELANQYKAAGMESSAAFAQAFMDVADEKMPQMAAVADSIVTPFQELQTSMTNFMDDFGNDFAYLINEMARGVRGLAAGIADIFGAGGASQGALDAQAVAGTYAGIYTGGGNPTGMLSSSNITGAIAAAILADQAGIDAGSAEFLNLLTTNAFGFSANDSLFNTDAGQQMLQQAAAIVGWYESYMAIVAGAQAGVTAPGGGPRSATARPGFASGDFSDISMGSMYSAYIMSAERQAQQLQLLLGGSAMTGGLRIISPESARDAENMAYAIEQIVDHLAGAGLEEAFLAPLRAAAEQSRAGADAAAEWAKNLESASLSQLFGQTSGGRLGEIDAAVLGALEAGGASQELLDAYRTAMGLDSGQLTQMSEQFDNEVVPLLEDVASQLGTNAYNRFRRAYEEAAGEAALGGQATVNMEDWAAGLTYYPGSGTGTGETYTIQSGDTLSAIAAANGKTVDELASLNNISNPGMIYAGQTLNLGGGSGGGMLIDQNFDMLEQSMLNAETSVSNMTEDAGTIADDMTTAVDTLSAGIEGVFSRTYQLPVELVISGGGVLAQLIAAAVSGAGGTTPGTSQNTGRSATGSGTRGDGTYSRGR